MVRRIVYKSRIGNKENKKRAFEKKKKSSNPVT